MGKLTHWAVLFTVIGVFAAILGFGGGAGIATTPALTLFWFSVAIVLLSCLGSVLKRS